MKKSRGVNDETKVIVWAKVAVKKTTPPPTPPQQTFFVILICLAEPNTYTFLLLLTLPILYHILHTTCDITELKFIIHSWLHTKTSSIHFAVYWLFDREQQHIVPRNWKIGILGLWLLASYGHVIYEILSLQLESSAV